MLAFSGMEAQSIKEIKGQHETLWAFILRLPLSFEAQVFYGLFFAGVCGAATSWLWKWANGNAEGIHHFTLRYTIGQLLWLAGSAIGAITTVGFATETGEFFGWLSVLWTGALAGFGGEVKNTKRPWTLEQRAEKESKGNP